MTAEWDDYRTRCVRPWLRHVRSCVIRKQELRDAIQQEHDLYDMMKAIQYDKDGGKSLPVHGDDSIASHIQRIADLVADMETVSVEYEAAVREARDVFDKLTCHECAGPIMDYYYLHLLTWGRVGRKIGYSEPRVKEIAAGATVECFDYMPREWRCKIPRADA